MPKPIQITAFRGRYDFLSNFYPYTILYQGDLYASNEHAFQANKTLDTLSRHPFMRQTMSAGDARRQGRKLTLRPNWNIIRVPVMLELLRIKFEPGSDMAANLLATNDAVLVEGNNWDDSFWGVVVGERRPSKRVPPQYEIETAGTEPELGANVLGALLMLVRAELKMKQ